MTESRRRYVWGPAMKFIINKDGDGERTVEADNHTFEADNEFVTFWKKDGTRQVPVFSIRTKNVREIEAEGTPNS